METIKYYVWRIPYGPKTWKLKIKSIELCSVRSIRMEYGNIEIPTVPCKQRFLASIEISHTDCNYFVTAVYVWLPSSVLRPSQSDWAMFTQYWNLTLFFFNYLKGPWVCDFSVLPGCFAAWLIFLGEFVIPTILFSKIVISTFRPLCFTPHGFSVFLVD